MNENKEIERRRNNEEKIKGRKEREREMEKSGRTPTLVASLEKNTENSIDIYKVLQMTQITL